MTDIQTNFFNDLLTMEELLSLLKGQYSKHTIYRWTQKEGMPYLKLKGKLWFSKNAIAVWFQEGVE
ncbi:MAG: helix-turn-helix domain-containing protein [Gammaproteobacteria bacterium]|nr:helix-turn-helix domain-containing protein [Gammaproteobacteria bacterium]